MLMKGKVVSIEAALPEFPIIIILAIRPLFVDL